MKMSWSSPPSCSIALADQVVGQRPRGGRCPSPAGRCSSPRRCRSRSGTPVAVHLLEEDDLLLVDLVDDDPREFHLHGHGRPLETGWDAATCDGKLARSAGRRLGTIMPVDNRLTGAHPMPTAPPPRILSPANRRQPTPTRTLEAAGFAVTAAGLGGIDPAEVARSQAVLVAVTRPGLSTAQALCRRWRIELGDSTCPIVWLRDRRRGRDGGPRRRGGRGAAPPRPRRISRGADEGLLAQSSTCTAGWPAGRPRRRTSTAAQQAYQQIDGDSDLTRRIHRGFLPRSLPGGRRGAVRRLLPAAEPHRRRLLRRASAWTRSTSACTSPMRWAAGCRPAAC